MTTMRERPSDTEVATWVVDARSPVLAHAHARGWWRRLSRPLVVGSFVGAVAAGGIAYAAVERTRTAEAPPVFTGDTTVEIGAPGPSDAWLNISVVFRCDKGDRISISDDVRQLMESGCPKNGTVTYGERGMFKSEPVSEVVGTRLRVKSTISRVYRIKARWGPRAQDGTVSALPPDGADGKPAFDLPTYPVNEYGLTVGDRITINQPEEAYPDLQPTTYRGKVAYFRTADQSQMAGNPAEAVRMMKERERLGLHVDGKIYQFVYEADGKTVLDKVFVGTYREE